MDAELDKLNQDSSSNFFRSGKLIISGNVNEYEHLNIIGRGSYGLVHRVRPKTTGQIFAMKYEFYGLSPPTLREICIYKSLPHHPSIVGFKKVVSDERGNVFVVMEYAETDLKRYMNIQKKPFNICQVKFLMKQLLEGIQFLHENGVMHRDLKPSNILLNRKGQLKICDFGLSRQFGQCGSGSYTPGVVTQSYRAPELLLGAKEYSCAIDIWSVGCIMAELLREVLFQGKCELEQIGSIYEILGTPNDNTWPGFSNLPGSRIEFVNKQPYNLLSLKFMDAAALSGAPRLTNLGFDLLKRLLTYDPQKRITAKEALDHAWFREY